MDDFSTSLNELLEKTFRSILKIEEKMLSGAGKRKLSINEIHLLEAVGAAGAEGLMISELARALSLTPPSVTIAVKKLEEKDLLQKKRGVQDGRTVSIVLTEHGRVVDRIHKRFHEHMVQAIASDMQEQERAVLLHAISRLNQYFSQKLLEK